MQRAEQTFFRSYPAFVSHLQDTSNSNAKASGLERLLVSSSLITFAVLLQVVYNVKTIKSKFIDSHSKIMLFILKCQCCM